MKRLGLHRVDGRSFWFAGYFNRFDRERMVRYAGAARADRFDESFGGRLPLAEAQIVKVFDPDAAAARPFAETFAGVEVAPSLEAFAEGLDGVIVPFPAGGPARAYETIAPLVRRGLPLFLDRIILEQREQLAGLLAEAQIRAAPLMVTCFMRYLAELLRPEPAAAVHSVVATAGGAPAGYGADLLDLIDELVASEPVSVLNAGDPHTDVLRIRYADGRHAILQLFGESSHARPPTQVTVIGEGWSRCLTLDGSQNHLGAFRQFEAFVRSIETRQPPVPYERVLRNGHLLAAAEVRRFGADVPLGVGSCTNGGERV